MTAPTQTGLGGAPRGPEFYSPGLDERPPGGAVPPGGGAHTARTGGRGPLIAAAGLVVALSAGAGGAAGWWAGGDGDTATAAAPAAPGAATGPAAPTGAVPGDLVGAAARALPGVVSVQVRGAGGGGTGSGFAYDARGHVITNNHVVDSGGAVSVVGSDGRRRTAEVVGRDARSDIAVLRVTGAGYPPLALADPASVRVGEPVLAVGSPLGLSGTVTAGIVSATDRPVRLGGTAGRTAVQTDASINPGNSGGPLVNARGEVIGVNTAIATLEGGGSIGIGFAVPIEEASQVAARIIAEG
ncbi:S1C family serine protease [Spirilliplanes yamanashiensis]|uniref:Uncharacterized protein n=1 Tax=Spirilliplanes yamanashiensis TaxID=42233 RepID=A0A8J3Y4Q7_9ACTN|nr:trypsin-like peptidase domain-containing protein [Spirilliplanes yamanashiensis]MDP9819783.1 S1-C subfamily serine protease [Spirilliplanes yamanashiensis]GIJ01397.1 hypothetical protein Sya03_07490 [Spirilliplanes yamanashiensis]